MSRLFVLFILLTRMNAEPEVNCVLDKTAQLSLQRVSPVNRGSTPGIPIAVPIRSSILQVSSFFVSARDHLSEQFSPLCELHSLDDRWSTADCIEDLLIQLTVWIINACQKYTPSAGACDPIIPGETRTPSKSDMSFVNIGILESFIVPRRLNMWSNYYPDVANFVSSRFTAARFVELGTAYGGLSDHVAGELPDSNVYAVDPFLGGYDRNDSVSSLYTVDSVVGLDVTPEALSKLWGQAIKLDQDKRHGCRYHQLRVTSVEAAALFSDRSVDVVFVDGLHTYEGVAADIIAWLPKLKRGGAFIFNDVAHDGLDPFPGVTRAVLDFTRGTDAELIVGSFQVPPGIGNAAMILR